MKQKKEKQKPSKAETTKFSERVGSTWPCRGLGVKSQSLVGLIGGPGYSGARCQGLAAVEIHSQGLGLSIRRRKEGREHKWRRKE